jgi:hypothetical protein
MTWEYENAGPGNIALMAELPRQAMLALGFGNSAESAATLAISSLLQPFDNLQQLIMPWQAWQAERSERCAVPLDILPALAEEFLASTVVLRSHLDKTYLGRAASASSSRARRAIVIALSPRAMASSAASKWEPRSNRRQMRRRRMISAPTDSTATSCERRSGSAASGSTQRRL